MDAGRHQAWSHQDGVGRIGDAAVELQHKIDTSSKNDICCLPYDPLIENSLSLHRQTSSRMPGSKTSGNGRSRGEAGRVSDLTCTMLRSYERDLRRLISTQNCCISSSSEMVSTLTATSCTLDRSPLYTCTQESVSTASLRTVLLLTGSSAVQPTLDFGRPKYYFAHICISERMAAWL
jgi:predicted solute-binding protein